MISQIIQALSQAAQWYMQLPGAQQTLVNACLYKGSQTIGRVYRDLPPSVRANIDEIIEWGIHQAFKVGIQAVLGEVGDKVLELLPNEGSIADFAKAAVKRGVEVGVEAAMEEVHRSL